MNSLLKLIWNFVFDLTGLDISSGANYKDWSFYLIELKADYESVKKLLKERHFTPQEITPGETRLQIVGCDMRAVQVIGSYYEISIQVPVKPLDDSPGEKFAHLYLPVSTEAARWTGVDIAGFPKFIAKIDIVKNNNQVICRLTSQETPILEFSMDDKVGTKTQYRWDYYGNRKQRIIQTTFDLEGLMSEEGANLNANLVLGNHAIANTLREILLSDEVVRTLIGHDVSGFLKKPVYIETVKNTG
jgi:hypothetical protein